MFIEQQLKQISQIPKGLYVKIRDYYIQSLRDLSNWLMYRFYKHTFPSGIVNSTLKNVRNDPPLSSFSVLREIFIVHHL
jgi:hypothetical protein